MPPVLVDTSAWFALYVPDDHDHSSAFQWYEANNQPLLTTDYVIDELLTLLRFRGELRRSLDVAQDLTKTLEIPIERITPADFDAAIGVFQRFGDKRWSFTDCTSFAVMKALKLRKAFAFDRHFEQMEGFSRLP
jgi:predicted nucleic acid-binding protein